MRKIKVAPSIPTEVEVKERSKNHAQIAVYPFETGYAVTVAHPLRRLILGSSVGYAPIWVKIKGVAHEFDRIRGMHEDVAVFIINLKNFRFNLKDGSDRATVSYSFSGHREVRAGDLNNEIVEVANEDQLLATLNDDAELEFTIGIAKGIGYVPSEDLLSEVPDDAIALDAFFSPVSKVSYSIENVLVEDDPNFEKVLFDIETYGQVKPIDAFKNAIEVFYSQLSIFNKVLDLKSENEPTSTNVASDDLKELLVPVDNIGLSARSFNSLDRAGIKYLGELVLMSENEIKEIKNLGKKSFDEISSVLEQRGFGSDFVLEEETKNALISRLNELKANA